MRSSRIFFLCALAIAAVVGCTSAEDGPRTIRGSVKVYRIYCYLGRNCPPPVAALVVSGRKEEVRLAGEASKALVEHEGKRIEVVGSFDAAKPNLFKVKSFRLLPWRAKQSAPSEQDLIEALEALTKARYLLVEAESGRSQPVEAVRDTLRRARAQVNVVLDTDPRHEEALQLAARIDEMLARLPPKKPSKQSFSQEVEDQLDRLTRMIRNNEACEAIRSSSRDLLVSLAVLTKPDRVATARLRKRYDALRSLAPDSSCLADSVSGADTIHRALESIASGKGDPALLTVIYDDLHGLHGGLRLTIRGTGQVEQEAKREPVGVARPVSREELMKLAALLLKHAVWEQRVAERMAVPDESRATLTVAYGSHSVRIWEWYNDLEKNRRIGEIAKFMKRIAWRQP